MGDVDFYTATAALGTIEVLDVDGLRLLYRLERAGEGFYNGIADRIGNDEAAALLRRNAREEVGHAERLRQALGLKLGVEYEPAGADLEPLDAPLPDRIPAAMLPAIVQGELDGDVGYQRWADREPDPAVARLLRQNGREEIQHCRRVQQVIDLLAESASPST